MTADDERPYVEPAEFVEAGYLQELNRRFLHPLGMALEVAAGPRPAGPHFVVRVWDYRDDPEGIRYDGVVDPAKTDAVDREWMRHAGVRSERLGYVIQPVPGRARQ